MIASNAYFNFTRDYASGSSQARNFSSGQIQNLKLRQFAHIIQAKKDLDSSIQRCQSVHDAKVQ